MNTTKEERSDDTLDCNTCLLQNFPACDELCRDKASLIAFCHEQVSRAEQAEAERDALAERLASIEHEQCKLKKIVTCLGPVGGTRVCKACWLAWAREQAGYVCDKKPRG